MAKRVLCGLEEIEDGGAKGFDPPAGRFTGMFAVRKGDDVHVYVNSCPHIGVPLNWGPDRFLDGRRRHIVCGTHGALFRIEDGVCIRGPCLGESLQRLPSSIENGEVLLDLEL